MLIIRGKTGKNVVFDEKLVNPGRITLNKRLSLGFKNKEKIMN